jgi:HSP20 family molecular chaperone IbpA
VQKQLDRITDNVPQWADEVSAVARSITSIVAAFERDFDELFDDILGRWRMPSAENEPAIVLERADCYEIRLCTGSFKPSELEVVASDKKLTVRAAHAQQTWERIISLAEPVETEQVKAKWADRILTVTLPKKEKRPPSPLE